MRAIEANGSIIVGLRRRIRRWLRSIGGAVLVTNATFGGARRFLVGFPSAIVNKLKCFRQLDGLLQGGFKILPEVMMREVKIQLKPEAKRNSTGTRKNVVQDYFLTVFNYLKETVATQKRIVGDQEILYARSGVRIVHGGAQLIGNQFVESVLCDRFLRPSCRDRSIVFFCEILICRQIVQKV